MTTKQTQNIKPADADIKWYLIDATDLVLGRLASQIATILRGKNKACYSPNQDCGDHVVVINADKIAVTGRKLAQKEYYSFNIAQEYNAIVPLLHERYGYDKKILLITDFMADIAAEDYQKKNL